RAKLSVDLASRKYWSTGRTTQERLGPHLSAPNRTRGRRRRVGLPAAARRQRAAPCGAALQKIGRRGMRPGLLDELDPQGLAAGAGRSEERRVGKEWRGRGGSGQAKREAK